MCRLLCLLCCFVSITLGQNNYKRTAVLIKKETSFGQNVFFRGGLDYSRKEGCDNATSLLSNPCAIPIKHNIILNEAYAAANSWSEGDDFLDWLGAEPKQGKWSGILAEGSPAVWTTNDPTKDTFNILNVYGPNYWLLDIDMDCSKTVNGSFEVKVFVGWQWENDVSQSAICSGSGAVQRPFSSRNHIAKCGAKNVFQFNDGACEISQFD